MSSTKNYEKLGEDSVTEEQTNPKKEEKVPPQQSFLDKVKDKLSIFKADGFKIIVGGCIVFSSALTIALIVDIYTKEPPRGHGAVSSDSAVCSGLGTNVLGDRGSAVDAAVVVALCLAVVKFSSTGLASGGYMLSHAPNGIDESFDFQFVAPMASTKDMFGGTKEKVEKGGLSFAVPGLIKGLKKAHNTYGYTSWKKLVEMVVKLAEDGFQIDSHAALQIKENISELPNDLKNILAPNGVPLKEGATLKLPKLAKVLKRIAEEGPNGFYTGTIADEIVKAVNTAGGNLTLSDLKNYEAVSRKPIITDLGQYKVMSVPSPSSGPVVFLALNILNELQIRTNEKFLVQSYHYMTETLKFAFAQRTLLGDPKFVKPDVTDDIIKKSFAKELAKLVAANQTFPPKHYGPEIKQPDTKGTASFSVLGSNGDMVSFVSTIGSAFGSKVVTESGLILNNGMGSFSSPGFTNIFGIQPAKANFIEAGKRPLSAASPLIAFHKQNPCKTHTIMSAGDGVRAISSTIQVLWNLLKFEDDLSTAIESPRLHHQLEPNVLRVEGNKFKKASLDYVVTGLQKLGHTVDDSASKLGSVNAAAKTNSKISTHADSRSGGGATEF